MNKFTTVLIWCNLAFALVSLIISRTTEGSHPLYHLGGIWLGDLMFVIAVLCIMNMLTLMATLRQRARSWTVRGNT